MSGKVQGVRPALSSSIPNFLAIIIYCFSIPYKTNIFSACTFSHTLPGKGERIRTALSICYNQFSKYLKNRQKIFIPVLAKFPFIQLNQNASKAISETNLK
jgi:hypothetical protein